LGFQVFLLSLPMKNSPDDILAAIAETAVERILHALKKDPVLAIFISGSVARGRIACFDTGDRLEIFSDLDLSVIVPNRSHWEDCRRRVRAAVAKVSLAGEGFKIFRPLDVGVYTLDDLNRQPVRPGTVDIATNHRLLYGNPAVPAALSSFAGAPMDPGEAMYLLENRMLERAEMFGERPSLLSPGDERYLVYTALKAGLDAGAALLIYSNRFSTDQTEWPERLREASGAPDSSSLFPESGLESIERFLDALWNLQSFMKRPECSYTTEWERAERLILAVWFNIAARVYPGEPTDWVRLVPARCRRGQPLANLREFRLLARRQGIGSLPAVQRGLSCRQLSPLTAMRLSGLVQAVIGRDKDGSDTAGLKKIFPPYLDRLTRLLNQPAGDIFDRTRALYKELN
jgi:predicted nucleotidyltransferase